MTHRRTGGLRLAALALLLPLGAAATEGGGGRVLTGQQVYSYAGVVPPTPGLVFGVTSANYQGDMGTTRTVPINRQLSAGIDATVSFNLANFTYVWPGAAGPWNFASAVGLPFQYTRVQATLGGAQAGLFRSDSGTQFADLLVTPIAAGYHFSETQHLSIALPIYAPTGAYDPERLANAGQNTWTFSPTLSYTRLAAGGAEFTAMAALDFYTRNDATDYQNGTVFRLEGIWTTAVAPGWSLGVAGGWIEQIEDDSGPLADRLNGFKGRSLGAGPIVNWSGKFGQQPAALSVRWIYEFEARNRPKGNGITLNLTLPFL